MPRSPPRCGCSTMEPLVQPTQLGSHGGHALGSEESDGEIHEMLSPRALGHVFQYPEMLLSLCQDDSACNYFKVFETLAWTKTLRWKTSQSQMFPFQKMLVQKISRIWEIQNLAEFHILFYFKVWLGTQLIH